MKLILIVILGLLALSCGGQVKRKDSNALFLIEQNAKNGYINKSGTVTIPAQFDEALPFSEGLAAVQVSRKWGFVDANGKLAIQPQFDRPSFASEGLIAVDINRKIGYVNSSGQFVINPQFDSQHKGPGDFPEFFASFFEGVAAVHVGQYFGFIDRTGKMIINPQFGFVYPFTQGLAAVSIDGQSQFGFVDKSGKFVINPQFQQALPFTRDLAAVSVGGKWGYIDKAGKLTINPHFDAAIPFSDEDLAGVRVNGKWGVINRTGNFIINPQFDNIVSGGPGIGKLLFCGADFSRMFYSEGLAAVQISGKWGYIDRSGQFVINPQFDDAFPFSNGLALVRSGSRSPSTSIRQVSMSGILLPNSFAIGTAVLSWPRRKYLACSGVREQPGSGS